MADFFFKKIDKRSREDLINFLQDHDRYSVISSWNLIMTFSNKVKVHSMDLPKNILDRAFELVYGEDPVSYYWNRQLSSRLSQFECEHGGCHKMGFNGRSGGYLILLGKKVDTLNTDPQEYYEKYYWTMESLRDRVGLVQEFDRMCDLIREDLIYYCQDRVPLLRRAL